MKNFDIEKYYYLNYNPINLSFDRKRTRGFSSLTALLLDLYYNSSSGTDSFLEIGIGGAGPHIDIRECLNKDIKIYGVDLYNPGLVGATGPGHEKNIKNYNQATAYLETDKPENVEFIWGVSGYDKSTVDLIDDNFGIIVDDGDPDRGSLNGLNAWKSKLNNTGYIISEGPFGNGVSTVWEKYQDETTRAHVLAECSEMNEMVIFDCSTLMYPVTGKISYPIPYLGVYTKSWEKFKTIKNKKFHEYYSKFIVAGQKYYDA